MGDESAQTPAQTPAEMAQPIIVDLGKQKSKNLKDLKKGQGKLWEDLLSVVEEVKEMLGEEGNNKVVIPVVVIYQEKPKRQRLDKIIFPNLR